MDLTLFNEYESAVRGYVRAFPAVFDRAIGSTIYSGDTEYIDFFAGAGGVNYGHNHPVIKRALIDYLESDGILHALDMATVTKAKFIEAFETHILKPRKLDHYKLQFTGPTGANAVEAALKLARLDTGRPHVVAFTHAFHGVSLGPLAVTANSWFRNAAGINLADTTFLPYENYIEGFDSLGYFEKLLNDPSSGLDKPAAVILETIQAEGGINIASNEWLRRLRTITKEHDIILIVDDIQVGCGRTGTFFSFEESGIVPDMVTLSKSLSASGLPMSLLLISAELDNWKPGQHNGTFRGNNLAFVSATKAIETFWTDTEFSEEIARKTVIITDALERIKASRGDLVADVRGRGFVQGIEFKDPEDAATVAKKAFEHGLIIERSGAHDEVLKLLPALTIEDEKLKKGLDIIADIVKHLA